MRSKWPTDCLIAKTGNKKPHVVQFQKLASKSVNRYIKISANGNDNCNGSSLCLDYPINDIYMPCNMGYGQGGDSWGRVGVAEFVDT